MLTFEWDDLQPRKDQHLLYFQGLAGKLQNRDSIKQAFSTLAGAR